MKIDLAAWVKNARVLGYRYEKNGWQMLYNGVLKGLKDKGIDLIGARGNEKILIQAKGWKNTRVIDSDIIYRLAGATKTYNISNNTNHLGVLVTSAKVPKDVRQLAEELNISINIIPFKKYYPVIKCVESEKKFYLPPETIGGTPRYDEIIIDITAGDQHAYSIEEAEALGFSRASAFTQS